MSSSASGTITPTTGGFTEDAFHRFMKGRDEPAWLVERREDAFAQFQAFPWPSAREEEWRRTDIRGLKLDAFAPPSADGPNAEARASFDEPWRALSEHYATGIAHINGALAREPDPARLGGAVLVDLNRAVKHYPEILERYLLTQAVTAGRRHLRRAPLGVLDEWFVALCAQGGQARGPAVQPDRAGAGGSVDLSHTLVVLEDGAEATLVRETTGAGAARHRRSTRARWRSSWRRGPGSGW